MLNKNTISRSHSKAQKTQWFKWRTSCKCAPRYI